MLNMPVSEMDSRYKLKGMLSLLKFAKEVETDNPDAEKFSAYTLRTMDENYMLEDILFYGIEPDSRYVSLKLSDDDVVISSAYASKFGLSVGDSITLKEKYEDKTYIFTVTQIYPYEASLVVFLSRDHVNYSATGLPEHLKSGGIPPFSGCVHNTNTAYLSAIQLLLLFLDFSVRLRTVFSLFRLRKDISAGC